MSEERWATIHEFPTYEISNRGSVYNLRTRRLMRISFTEHGNAKITLTSYDGSRHTRSVSYLVAENFVAAPFPDCDSLIFLDGDMSNLDASNMAWRTPRFAWKYMRQLRTPQPIFYQNLEVKNLTTKTKYESVIQAGIKEGLLFEDIWRSTWSHESIYPYGHEFEIISRV